MQSSDFKAVKPSKEQLEAIADFEIRFYVLGKQIEETIPNSAHRTAALRKLLEAKMTLVHTITRSDIQPHPSVVDESKACNSTFEAGLREQGF